MRKRKHNRLIDIAMNAGFENPASFSDAFKKPFWANTFPFRRSTGWKFMNRCRAARFPLSFHRVNLFPDVPEHETITSIYLPLQRVGPATACDPKL
jgi:hypothetical protein